MEIYSEDNADRDRVFELEHASATIDEVQTHYVPANTDESVCNKFLDLTSPKVALAKTGAKSTCMEQASFLEKMDARRFMEKQENYNDCFTYERKHCGMLMKFQ